MPIMKATRAPPKPASISSVAGLTMSMLPDKSAWVPVADSIYFKSTAKPYLLNTPLLSTHRTSITFRTRHRTNQKYGRGLLSLSTVGGRLALPAGYPSRHGRRTRSWLANLGCAVSLGIAENNQKAEGNLVWR